MSNLREVAASTAKGSFILAIGSFLSLFSSAIGMIFVARMLTPSEYGMYSISLVLPGIFLLFNDFGIDQAIIRFLPKFRSEGNNKKH
jgi:stage V sporulation protein B